VPTKRELIIWQLVLVLAGALVARKWPDAGLIVVVTAMGLYIAARAKGCVRDLRHFSTKPLREQARALVPVLYLLVLVGIILAGRVSYFPILLILSTDLLL
jgi:hypothetical protein